MKKLILTAALGVACVSAFAQGNFLFNNFGGGANAPVFDTDGTTKLGNSFMADLYWGPAGTTDSSVLTALGLPATFSGSGYFLGGSRTISANTGGLNIAVQVRVWDSAHGSSYAQAAATPGAKLGESSVFALALVTGATPPNTLSGMTSFSLHAVPEPSTLALAGLGFAGLLVLRRRK